ncbi:hypothetical protein V2J09_014062 [Rumex salicifolius]
MARNCGKYGWEFERDCFVSLNLWVISCSCSSKLGCGYVHPAWRSKLGGGLVFRHGAPLPVASDGDVHLRVHGSVRVWDSVAPHPQRHLLALHCGLPKRTVEDESPQDDNIVDSVPITKRNNEDEVNYKRRRSLMKSVGEDD